MSYRTFKRSARNFREFASAEKIEDETGLTYGEARDRCLDYNADLTDREKEEGTKMEFEEE